ncbi:MAG: hypothetical protein AB8E82_08300 [Aureispira sp.]
MRIQHPFIWGCALVISLAACETTTPENTSQTTAPTIEQSTTVDLPESNPTPPTTSVPQETSGNWSLSIEDFIQDGQTMLLDAEGDLNNDDIPDKVLVLNNPQSMAKPDDLSPPRSFIILQGNPQGQYRLWANSDQVILCEECGGLTGDPLRTLKIEQQTILIKQDGGSREQWERNSSLALDTSNEQWMIIKDHMKVVDTYDASNNSERSLLTKEQLPLEQYNVYKGQ